jgi:hypothetical protein
MNDVQCYHHVRWGRVKVGMTRLGGVAFLVCFTAIVSLLVAGLLVNRRLNFVPTCMALYLVLVGWVVGLAVFNLYPDVCLDDEGIFISFMFGRAKIPWHLVLSVHTRRFPFRRTLVSARRITPLHYVYGWVYLRSLRLSFIVDSSLEHHDELVAEIERRIQATRSPS